MTTYRNPYPTADIIIERPEGIVFVERRNPPYGYALPGGFIEYGESAEAAAIREAKEETGLDVTLTRLLGVYSDPKRDPRHHTLSVVYVGRADGEPKAGDDAKSLIIANPETPPEPLAFDHAKIVADYLNSRK